MMLTDTLSQYEQVRWFNLYASNPDAPSRYHRNWENYLREEPVGITHSGTTMHRVGDGWINTLSPIAPGDFWQVLSNRHDKWILLRRENLLRQYLSKLVGVVLRSYHVSEPRTVDPGPVRIPVQELLEFVGSVKSLHERIDCHFPEALCITYEELSGRWGDTFCRVQDYLGLPRMTTLPVTYRQETRPLRRAIENYDELALYLEHRGYEDWLD
jgi:hypothetical protein